MTPKTESNEPTVFCPKCGGDEIRIKQVAYGTGPVNGWTMDGGQLECTDIDDPSDAEWEIDDDADQFVCGNHECRWEGTLEDLIVKSAEGLSEGPTHAD